MSSKDRGALGDEVQSRAKPVTQGGAALAQAEEITREQRRSRRKRVVRARTISVKRMTKRELEIGRSLYPESDYWKPGAARPANWDHAHVHLYLVSITSTLTCLHVLAP